jgi:hypothetical protein
MLAAHDLNYMAEAGILGLSSGGDGHLSFRQFWRLISQGAYPAIINILPRPQSRNKKEAPISTSRW